MYTGCGLRWAGWQSEAPGSLVRLETVAYLVVWLRRVVEGSRAWADPARIDTLGNPASA